MAPSGDLPVLPVSDFVALLNQTLEFAYTSVVVSGELANFKIWRERLVFFDLKDEGAVINCFAFVSQLPGPLEDGMTLEVRGQPHYHETRGFSFNVQRVQLAGEGTIKKAAELLQAKLTAEGLFALERKRALPYPPQRIGLITSEQSAAYADFTKILAARWGGVAIELIDVQVQGEAAPAQIVAAIEQFNALAKPPEVVVLIRGGGSPEDLAAFSTEQVTRAVAASRVPTLVAIGHEVDLSLAELAADQRASTPSNAAELLTPDRRHQLTVLTEMQQQLVRALRQSVEDQRLSVNRWQEQLVLAIQQRLSDARQQVTLHGQLLEAYSPQAALSRGYAIIRAQQQLISSVKQLHRGQSLDVQFHDGVAQTTVHQIEKG
ncbi:MAG TPA: exodeoxyribonuclease VII large subunit [Candidatus Saccharimonadales bacterium]|nr:exodeoxyribonuclease VII large subunit [Candidatus Saccharimonadales bacterium]